MYADMVCKLSKEFIYKLPKTKGSPTFDVGVGVGVVGCFHLVKEGHEDDWRTTLKTKKGLFKCTRLTELKFLQVT